MHFIRNVGEMFWPHDDFLNLFSLWPTTANQTGCVITGRSRSSLGDRTDCILLISSLKFFLSFPVSAEFLVRFMTLLGLNSCNKFWAYDFHLLPVNLSSFHFSHSFYNFQVLCGFFLYLLYLPFSISLTFSVLVPTKTLYVSSFKFLFLCFCFCFQLH